MLPPAVMKKFMAASPSNEGELETSMTISLLARRSSRPSPVIVSTPVPGAAATASWPRLRNSSTTLEPIRPVPPMTAIWNMGTFLSPGERVRSRDLERPAKPVLERSRREARMNTADQRFFGNLGPEVGHVRIDDHAAVVAVRSQHLLGERRQAHGVRPDDLDHRAR